MFDPMNHNKYPNATRSICTARNSFASGGAAGYTNTRRPLSVVGRGQRPQSANVGFCAETAQLEMITPDLPCRSNSVGWRGLFHGVVELAVLLLLFAAGYGVLLLGAGL